MEKKKILFVYTGYEQGSWGNIAYSCKAHYYIMPGILYCVNSLRNDPELSKSCDIQYRFFNRTVESSEDILRHLTEEHWDLIGFSSYCWNIEDHRQFAQNLKEFSPETKIIFGGPEVYLENEMESLSFFRANPFIDCLVFGDAEKKLPAIVKAILKKDAGPCDSVTGFAFAPSDKLLQNFDPEPALNLNIIPSIYPFDIAIPHSKDSGLTMVYETGRGCPYRCIYCKFGHRSARVQRIELSRVERELQWLMSQKIERINFADAVFDLHPDYAKNVCRIIIENNISTSILFYCSFSKLDEELASLFSKTQCQIGIGIQSTNLAALKTMRRTLNTELFKGIKKILQQSHLNFYTDIIFGLPKDNPESFAKSFNQAITLKPAFIMAFPLSLIKGTELAEKVEHYEVIEYSQEKLNALNLMCDIEYKNIALYKDFSDTDLEKFDDLTLTLFYFYNRFYYSLSYLLHRTSDDAFSMYQSIGRKTKEFLKKIGQTASNTNFIDGFQDEIFNIFSTICIKESIGENEISAFNELFKIDILRILMLISPHRKKIFDSSYEKRRLKTDDIPVENERTVRVIKVAYGKILSLPYRLSDLLHLNELKDSIAPYQDQVLMYAPFNHWNTTICRVSPLERFLIEFIPENRGIRLRSVLQATKRQFRSGISGNEITSDIIKNKLKLLVEREIILIYKDK